MLTAKGDGGIAVALGNRVGARRLGAPFAAAVLLVGAGIFPVTAAMPARQTGITQVPANSVRLSGAATQQLPAAPDTTGTWSSVMDWGLQAKHMAALPTGKVLVWSTGDNASVWDPGSNSFTPAPALFGDLHCAGQSMLADGRVIVVGGQNVSPHNGTSITSLFDPFSGTWTKGPDMAYLRWYATSTTLADGRVLATSGDAPDGTRATIPEVYDPVANTWTKLTGAPRSQSLYPLMFVLPDKRVYEAGPGSATAILDTSGAGSWTPGPANAYSTSGYSESAVMYAPGKIMRAGGGDPSINRVSVIDMTAASPAWRDVAPMAFARRRMNLTILADGSVMAIGGTRAADDASQAVLEGEIWNPSTEQWTTVGAMTEPRMYHSAAVLLADGRIVVGGGEAAGRLRAQVYSPPYLFKGARPVITTAPAMAGYGTSFSIATPDAASITSVALIRLSAGTHAFDQNQRYVPLTFSAGSGSLSVTSPASGGVAPPGYYQLVIKNGSGVPSVARYIRVDTGGNLQPGTIHGTITDSASGLPISGATASIGNNVATSNASGSYTLSNVPSGDQTVMFVASGYATVTRSQTIVAGGSFQLDVALAPPGSLSGHVNDSATTLPIAAATITYPGGETTTDGNGAYSISAIASGPQLIAASAPGHVSSQQSVTVPAGSGTTLDFALVQSATFLTGGVSDLTTAQPIAGAVVSYPGGGSTTTDALGRYRLDVPPGTYTLTASASGHDPLSHDAIVSAGTYAVTDFALAVTVVPSSTLSIVASADSYVGSTNPTRNFGTASSVRIRGGTTASPGTYVAYFRFPVSGLAGRSVSAAKIHLFNTDASTDGGQAFAAGDGWTETGITWSNAPATVGAALGSVASVTVNTWVDINLPATAFPSDGSYTLALVSHSTNSGYYTSRSGTNKPELDLTLGSDLRRRRLRRLRRHLRAGRSQLSASRPRVVWPRCRSRSRTRRRDHRRPGHWDFGDGTGSVHAPNTYVRECRNVHDRSDRLEHQRVIVDDSPGHRHGLAATTTATATVVTARGSHLRIRPPGRSGDRSRQDSRSGSAPNCLATRRDDVRARLGFDRRLP